MFEEPEARLLFDYYVYKGLDERMQENTALFKHKICFIEASYNLYKIFYLRNSEKSQELKALQAKIDKVIENYTPRKQEQER